MLFCVHALLSLPSQSDVVILILLCKASITPMSFSDNISYNWQGVFFYFLFFFAYATVKVNGRRTFKDIQLGGG